MGSTEELFAAIEAGDADLVRSMLTAEPSLASAHDAQGVSVLMRAPYRFDQELVDAVVGEGWKLDVFEAASLGDVERLRVLLDGDPSLVTAFSSDGFTALHLPAFFGGVDAARLLLARGTDLGATNDDGATVLSMAEEGGSADVVARVSAALGS